MTIFGHLQEPAQPPRPSVPSKTGAPMVTIRRIETPGRVEPMVTISMAKNGGNNQKSGAAGSGSQKDDKLLYTLVNGQAMRTNEAPSDLLPNAKLMDANLSKKQKKKLKKQAKNGDSAGAGLGMPEQHIPPTFNIPTPMGVPQTPSMYQNSMQVSNLLFLLMFFFQTLH